MSHTFDVEASGSPPLWALRVDGQVEDLFRLRNDATAEGERIVELLNRSDILDLERKIDRAEDRVSTRDEAKEWGGVDL